MASRGQQRAAEQGPVSHKETSLWRPLNYQETSLDGGSKGEELTGNVHRQPRRRANSPLGEIKELSPWDPRNFSWAQGERNRLAPLYNPTTSVDHQNHWWAGWDPLARGPQREPQMLFCLLICSKNAVVLLSGKIPSPYPFPHSSPPKPLFSALSICSIGSCGG